MLLPCDVPTAHRCRGACPPTAFTMWQHYYSSTVPRGGMSDGFRQEDGPIEQYRDTEYSTVLYITVGPPVLCGVGVPTKAAQGSVDSSVCGHWKQPRIASTPQLQYSVFDCWWKSREECYLLDYFAKSNPTEYYYSNSWTNSCHVVTRYSTFNRNKLDCWTATY